MGDMRPTVYGYFKANLALSFTRWEKHEAMGSLFQILLSLTVPALLAWLAIPSSWLNEAIARFGAGLGIGFILLVFVVTPIRMWIDNQKRIMKLENDASPKLAMLVGDDNIFREQKYNDQEIFTTLRLGVLNTSSRVVRGVELSIANIKSKKSDYVFQFGKRVCAIDEYNPRIEINPGIPKYYQIARVRQLLKAMDDDFRFDLGPFVGGEGGSIPRGDYVVKVWVSGENSPGYFEYFDLGIDENNNVILRRNQNSNSGPRQVSES